MEDNLYVVEGLNFFKRNWKKYILAFALSLLLIVALFFYSARSNKNDQNVNQDKNYTFSFILENKDGYIFSKNEMIKEIFASEYVKTHSDISAEDVIDTLTITYTDNNGKMLVETPDKELATYLYKFIEDSSSRFFIDKRAYVLSDKVDLSKEKAFEGISKKKIMIYVLLIVTLTFIIGTIIASISEKRNKKISQKFTLKDSNEIIDVTLLREQTNEKIQEKLTNLINNPPLNKIVVMKDQKFLTVSELNNSVYLTDSLDKVENLPFIPELVVIICEKNSTEKAWFGYQKELAKNYSEKVNCIYI
ncbi:hypothetical protein ATZ33_18025 [Enterococcus silesiacus]|uniref:Capsular polysaccharide biosynthesis protein n=1 Tax=Enterococcus silesiacus TaxID=332949 RepID=A0A0S3KG02_9ENTE|nr:hypothetical protein [Enterococcus silesiacus]ALS03201.1 hypothetical protein ATZ33_18025 [Enterococcus silesiacus]OJG89354.1 hypothetical protein RV15_GL001661 [Enterococcus silesiacus]